MEEKIQKREKWQKSLKEKQRKGREYEQEMQCLQGLKTDFEFF